MKILVIDDEKPTLTMFKLFLTAYGYEVHTAENGEKGLALFDEITPDIVFTDIRMPGIDGLQVLKSIRESGIPSEVIVITGHGDMERAMEALDLNASDFINKPVERRALNAALARAEKRRSRPGDLPAAFSQQISAQTLVISIKGKLTATAENAFSALFSPPFPGEVHTVTIRFDESFSIDRGGITLLMDVLQTLKKKSIAVVLDHLTCNHARIFKMAGMDKLARLNETQSEDF